MIVRMDRVFKDSVQPVVKEDESHPQINYYKVSEEKDPFPDASLLEPLDAEKNSEVEEGVDKMVQEAMLKCLPKDGHDALAQVVFDHKDVFRTYFSSGSPAKIPPLKVDLVDDVNLFAFTCAAVRKNNANYLRIWCETLWALV